MPDNHGVLARHAAIVTGASSGIGLGVAEALADAGAAVVVNYHSSGEAADELVGRIIGAGNRSITGTAAVQAAPAVPEPATWAMMIGGFTLVGAAMRRRQQTSTVTYA